MPRLAPMGSTGVRFEREDGHSRRALSESAWLASIVRQLRLAASHKHPDRLRVEVGRAIEQMVQLREQVLRVHVNPMLAVVGNPTRGGEQVVLSRGGVQAVIYTHDRDGTNRIHGFGDVPLHIDDTRNGLLVEGLRRSTGVSMIGARDKKSVTIQGDHGQEVWDWFPDEDAR